MTSSSDQRLHPEHQIAPSDGLEFPGRRKLTLSFELPKGSYATVLLKRLFHEPVSVDEEDSRP